MYQIQEGDLTAYLDGERNPAVVKALAESPELREELAQLKEFDDWCKRNFGGIDRPDSQHLVDVITNQADNEQSEMVTVYLQVSARGRREMFNLLASLSKNYRNQKFTIPIVWDSEHTLSTRQELFDFLSTRVGNYPKKKYPRRKRK